MKGKLILEDGCVFCGELLNESEATGEVVFNTGMTGYQEILTDPSYCGQIVVLTYPLIGNYGASACADQSCRPYVHGFVIGELCGFPSSWKMEETLEHFLTRHKVPCLYGVDTRAITRHIRASGTMKGILVQEAAPEETVETFLSVPLKTEVVKEVTTPKIYKMENDGPSVVVMDFGVKRNILRSLQRLGCNLTIVPAQTAAEDILALHPDGVFLSNGPGDPKVLTEIIANVRKLLGKVPIFGICLGHQLLSLALGADTYKLKFGHRGSNQPVKDLRTGRVQISSQNHGYAVDEASMRNLPIEITHIAVNDGTVEGMRHKELPVFSVQYHPEASPGPDDNTYLFDEFWSHLTKGE